MSSKNETITDKINLKYEVVLGMIQKNNLQVPLALIISSLIAMFFNYQSAFLFFSLITLLKFMELLMLINKNISNDLYTFLKNIVFIFPILFIFKNAWNIRESNINKETLKNEPELNAIIGVLYVLLIAQIAMVYWATSKFSRDGGTDVFGNNVKIMMLYFVFIFGFSLFIFELTYHLKAAGNAKTDD